VAPGWLAQVKPLPGFAEPFADYAGQGSAVVGDLLAAATPEERQARVHEQVALVLRMDRE
jgi:hypothetical protein